MGVILANGVEFVRGSSCFPVMGGLFQLEESNKTESKVVSPLWGLFLTTKKAKLLIICCFPIMGVIPEFPHKINENNNLTRLETLELVLLEQHK